MPACCPGGAGMRRHLNGSHPGLPYSGAAESFVSFIPLFDGVAGPRQTDRHASHGTANPPLSRELLQFGLVRLGTERVHALHGLRHVLHQGGTDSMNGLVTG